MLEVVGRANRRRQHKEHKLSCEIHGAIHVWRRVCCGRMAVAIVHRYRRESCARADTAERICVRVWRRLRVQTAPSWPPPPLHSSHRAAQRLAYRPRHRSHAARRAARTCISRVLPAPHADNARLKAKLACDRRACHANRPPQGGIGREPPHDKPPRYSEGATHRHRAYPEICMGTLPVEIS